MTVGLIALAAFLLSGQVNRGIYELAWNARSISPWSWVPAPATRRSWLDCVPVWGWWRLRRESDLHGRGFWIRPALIEIALIVGLPGLFLFEREGGLLPIGAPPLAESMVLGQYVRHAALILFMMVASFIDIDEKTIPDAVTVPGTLLAFGLAAAWPVGPLSAFQPQDIPPRPVDLWVHTPGDWPAWLDGGWGLGLTVFFFFVGWYAIMPKVLWYKGGLRKFCRLLWASIARYHVRERATWLLAAVMLPLLSLTVVSWWLGGARWQAVCTAWIGFAAGGGAVWAVRIVGGLALRQEAMGFGDVTLMAMIGAYLGWQPVLMIFFLAPFTGLVVAIAQRLLTGRPDIAYGPFLCLATLILILFWPAVWANWGYAIFVLGWFLPAVLVVCLIALGVSLVLVQLVKSRLIHS